MSKKPSGGSHGCIQGRPMAFGNRFSQNCAWLGMVAAILSTPFSVYSQSLVGADMAYQVETQSTAISVNQLEGESINLFDRKIHWNPIDLRVPGNGLPIEIGRTHRSSPSGWFDWWRGDMYNWELNTPRISVAHSIHGVVNNRLQSLMYGCGLGNPRYVHVMIPGVSDFRPVAVNSGVAYPHTASPPHGQFNNNWLMYCNQPLTTRSQSSDHNGQALPATTDRGVTLVSPDGIKYHFSYYAIEQGTPAPVPKDPNDTSWGTTIRHVSTMHVTDIEDRFGNFLTYHYEQRPDNNGGRVLRLQRVSASDGREVILNYRVDDHGQTGLPGSGRHLESVSHNGRTMRYSYREGDSGQPPQLHRVTDDDGRHTEYSYYPFATAEAGRDLVSRVQLPTGAAVEYEYDFMASLQTDDCSQVIGVAPGIPGIPYIVAHAAVSQRRVIDNGNIIYTANYKSEYIKDTQTMNRHFLVTEVGGPTTRERYYNACYDPVPDSPVTNQVDARQLTLVRHETYGGPSRNTLLRRVDTEWNTYLDGGQYRLALGGLAFQSSYRLWQSRVTTTVGADVFERIYSAPNQFAQPTQVVRGNSVHGMTRAESIAYHNNTSRWILGQVQSVRCVEPAECRPAQEPDGIVMQRVDYNAFALPIRSYSFGKILETRTYDTSASLASGQRGTLLTSTDGNSNITRYSGWRAGIPQLIEFSDGKTQARNVDQNGWLRWSTNETGSRTCFDFDVIGRIKKTTFTSESHPNTCNDSAWHPSIYRYDRLSSAEHGVPVGYWRHTTETGASREIVYYNTLMRPVLSMSYDNSDEVGTKSFVRHAYDSEGRLNFTSYPSLSPTASTGVRTEFDALGRPTAFRQDSEWGVLTTTTEYLSELRTRVTNPRTYQTITRYLAWDEPSWGDPISITHPGGAFTDISRDVFGKPKAIIRRNADHSVSLTRSYVYNSHQELCKVVEPESGATIMQYDGAGNLAWSASGTTFIGTASCDTANVPVPQRTVRTYDERNRVEAINFPDGRGDTTTDYTPDGLMERLTAYNEGGAVVTTTYDYNRRRLLAGESLSVNGHQWTLGYSYDAHGSLASHQFPSGQGVDYAPDALGRQTRAGSFAYGVEYFPSGTLRQFAYGNGIVRNSTQNVRGLVDRTRDTRGSVAILDDGLDYDSNANVVGISDGLPGHRGDRIMEYDSVDRLVRTDSPMFGSAIYDYDVLDNLRKARVTSGSSQRNHTYEYDGKNRLTEVRSTVHGSLVSSLTYDARGNLAVRDGQPYIFDFGNRLREVPGVERYLYDGHGRRVRAVRDGASIYSLYDQGGVLRFQRNERSGVETEFVHVGGQLVAQLESPIQVSAPELNAPTSNYDGIFTLIVGSVPSANLYRVEERKSAGSWQEIYAGPGLSVALSGKGNGTWDYRARACMGESCSEYSSPVSVFVTLPPSIAPVLDAPASVFQSDFAVRWNLVETATRYELEQRHSGQPWGVVYDGVGTSADISNRTNGAWQYRVRACNGIPCGPFSEISNVVVLLPPGVPSISAPEANHTGDYQINWSPVPTAESYRLEECAGSSECTLMDVSDALSWEAVNRANGEWLYRVQACNLAGCGGFSLQAQVDVLHPPLAPNLTVPSITGWIRYSVNWTHSDTADTYVLQERSVPVGSTPEEWYSIQEGPDLGRTVFAQPEGVWDYRVQACNVGGCSDFSDTERVVRVRPPAAPVLTAPEDVGHLRYTIHWTSSNDATFYELEERLQGDEWVRIQNSSQTQAMRIGQNQGIWEYRVRACNEYGCGAYSNVGVVSIQSGIAEEGESITYLLPLSDSLLRYICNSEKRAWS